MFASLMPFDFILDEKNERSKQVIRTKVVEYMQRAEKLKVYCAYVLLFLSLLLVTLYFDASSSRPFSKSKREETPRRRFRNPEAVARVVAAKAKRMARMTIQRRPSSEVHWRAPS